MAGNRTYIPFEDTISRAGAPKRAVITDIPTLLATNNYKDGPFLTYAPSYQGVPGRPPNDPRNLADGLVPPGPTVAIEPGPNVGSGHVIYRAASGQHKVLPLGITSPGQLERKEKRTVSNPQSMVEPPGHSPLSAALQSAGVSGPSAAPAPKQNLPLPLTLAEGVPVVINFPQAPPQQYVGLTPNGPPAPYPNNSSAPTHIVTRINANGQFAINASKITSTVNDIGQKVLLVPDYYGRGHDLEVVFPGDMVKTSGSRKRGQPSLFHRRLAKFIKPVTGPGCWIPERLDEDLDGDDEELCWQTICKKAGLDELQAKILLQSYFSFAFPEATPPTEWHFPELSADERRMYLTYHKFQGWMNSIAKMKAFTPKNPMNADPVFTDYGLITTVKENPNKVLPIFGSSALENPTLAQVRGKTLYQDVQFVLFSGWMGKTTPTVPLRSIPPLGEEEFLPSLALRFKLDISVNSFTPYEVSLLTASCHHGLKALLGPDFLSTPASAPQILFHCSRNRRFRSVDLVARSAEQFQKMSRMVLTFPGRNCPVTVKRPDFVGSGLREQVLRMELHYPCADKSLHEILQRLVLPLRALLSPHVIVMDIFAEQRPPAPPRPASAPALTGNFVLSFIPRGDLATAKWSIQAWHKFAAANMPVELVAADGEPVRLEFPGRPDLCGGVACGVRERHVRFKCDAVPEKDGYERWVAEGGGF